MWLLNLTLLTSTEKDLEAQRMAIDSNLAHPNSFKLLDQAMSLQSLFQVSSHLVYTKDYKGRAGEET